MIIIRTKRKHKDAVVIIVCLIAALAARVVPYFAPEQAVMSDVSLSANNNDERLAFLKSHGIESEKEPFEIKDIIIPSSFDGLYETFEILQKSQGLSLEKFRGKRVKRYSYYISNPPEGFGKTAAELIVLDGEIIACCLCDLQKNGGFAKIIG